MEPKNPSTTSKPPLPPASSTTTFEPPPSGPTPRRRGGNKRKANSSNTSSASKRLAREKHFFPPHLQNHNGPITRARQSPNKLAAVASSSASAFVAQSSSYVAATSEQKQQGNGFVSPFQGGETSATAAQQALANEESHVPSELEIDKEFEAIRSRDPNSHVVPTHAAWFSWTKIHPLEEQALALFFNGKSEKRTSETYMEIRNSIMRKFHTDPKTQIGPKDLLELSSGELDAKKEVMEFLDYWGLINFHPFPVDACSTVEIDADGSTRMSSVFEKLYQFEAVQPRPLGGPKIDLSTQTTVPRLLPESTVADEVRQQGPAVEYHCNSCSADCSRKRYHCQKQADFDLCSECYNNGKFDSGMSPADFILMEPAEVPGVSGGSWTDQETLLLLEALEIFGENNWSEIAEHVATKSKAQCILHFIQMPIEDTFLEGKDDFDASLQANQDLGTSNEDSSVLKDSLQKMEVKIANDGSSPSKELSEITESKSATNNDSCSLNKPPEITESKSLANGEHSSSPKVDSSEKIDISDVKIAQEVTVDHAVTALKEAFEAVGSLLGAEESLSFADAGNPVMALAAYLAALVEPDISAGSSRSSLKAASEDSPGIHLAARHCFILEDPPKELEEPPASESADVEMLEPETHEDVEDCKDIISKEENHQAENQTVLLENDTVLEGCDVKHCISEKTADAIPKDTLPLVSPKDKGNAKLCVANKSDDATDKEDPPSTLKESNVLALPAECQPCNTNGTIEPIMPSDVMFCSEKKSDDVASLDETPNCSDVQKDVDIVSKSALLENKDIPTTVTPSLAEETGSQSGVGNPEVVDHNSEKSCDFVQTQNDQNVNVDSSELIAQPKDDQNVNVDSDGLIAQSKDDQNVNVDSSGLIAHKNDDQDSSGLITQPENEQNDSSELIAQPKDDQNVNVDGSGLTAQPKDDQNVSVDGSGITAQPKDDQNVSVDGSGITAQPKDDQNVSVDGSGLTAPPKDDQNVSVDGSGITAQPKDDQNVSVDGSGLTAPPKDDQKVDRVKRAALTALSAAAVKAKLLADQEENQIRQLVSFLIDKQLHKLETKLAFFAEMESIILRFREQIFRSRERLSEERNQIIASRLGSSRAAGQLPIPTNRVAMSYVNAVPRSLPRGPCNPSR